MTNLVNEFSNHLADAIAASAPSVVRVDGRRSAPSTGVVFDRGVIVTANHALHADETVGVALHDGTNVAATIAGRDAASDIAVLRIDRDDLPPLAWSDTGALRVGHVVVAIGRPGRSARATLGVASAIANEWRSGATKLERYIESDRALPPGFSGGPLLDASGNALGINTSQLLRGAALTIPTEALRRIVPALLAHGSVPRPFLGVGVYPVRVSDEERGLIVMSVKPGSAAAEGGIIVGDILVALDGRPLRHPGDLHELLRDDAVGRASQARIVRGGEAKELSLTVGAN